MKDTKDNSFTAHDATDASLTASDAADTSATTTDTANAGMPPTDSNNTCLTTGSPDDKINDNIILFIVDDIMQIFRCGSKFEYGGITWTLGAARLDTARRAS
jgi:hypothetical protein